MLELYAGIEAGRGEFLSAREHYERALHIRDRVVGRAHPLYAEVEAGLASTLASLGDKNAALEAL